MRRRPPAPWFVAGPMALILSSALGCSAPASLAEAILERPDEFPPDTQVIVPPSSRSPLGHRKANEAGERRISMEIEPCFVVDPQQSGGLGEITVSYDNAAELKAEFGLVLGEAGVQIGDASRATLTLRDLTIEEGIGVPDPNTCDFAEDTTVTVATRAIRARTAELRFSEVTGTRGGAVATRGEMEGTVGWRFEEGERGLVAGKDIVLAASLARVEVDVESSVVDLGNRIDGGRSVPLPGELDGVVVIERFDVAAGADQQGLLTLRIEPTAAKARAVDARCDPAGSVTLGYARRCLARLGTTALAVWWETTGGPDAARVALKLRSYRMKAR